MSSERYLLEKLLEASKGIVGVLGKIIELKKKQIESTHTPKPDSRYWEIVGVSLQCHGEELSIVKDKLVIYNFMRGDERYSSYKIHSVKRRQ